MLVWDRLNTRTSHAMRELTGACAWLTALVKTRLRRMQYQPGLLEGFLAKPRLDLPPLQ